MPSAPVSATKPETGDRPSSNQDSGALNQVSTEASETEASHGNGASHGNDLEDGEMGDRSPQGFLPVLRNRNFLTLWAGQVFSQLADKVYLVLMIIIITSQFQSAGQTVSGWVSSIMVASTIPAMLFGSIAGVYVDYWSKQAVLVSTNLMRGALVLALPVLLWLSHGWSPIANIPIGFMVLLVVTFLVSTLTQFFAPAEQAVIPLLVERKHLLSANSLYTTTMMASVIVGFAVGEPLLVLADGAIAQGIAGVDIGKELLVGGSYIAAGLLLLLIRPPRRDASTHQNPPPVWENIRDGLRYLKQQPTVRAAILQLIMLSSIFAALAVLAVRLAEVMPALKSSQFGFLLAAGGAGMAVGAFLIGHYGHSIARSRLSVYGSIGMGIALGGMSVMTHYLIPTLLLLVGFGACAALVGVPMQTAIQEETPPHMRGKVFGLQNNAINIALSLPLALAGLAETLFGLQLVFLVLAGVAIASGLLTWSLASRSTHGN
ncbi:MAG: MFS transporter [Kaiparowitsia implicata GSE-PSE-MK54-09C]|nr:MFS transporter [Kaiparowitsia implicata GSE-PSE-MK54-09C]